MDEASLERRYKLLQWMLHPDKAVSRSAEERDFSAAHASHINQAYGVLRRPLSRANYLVGPARAACRGRRRRAAARPRRGPTRWCGPHIDLPAALAAPAARGCARVPAADRGWRDL